MQGLDRAKLLAALRRLGELAREDSLQVDISVFGGSALMLAFDRRAMTKDVDAIFRPRDQVLGLARRVASEMRLTEGWLNDDVRQFLAPQGARRELPLDLPGLRIFVPTTSYLLAMKALAGRRTLPGYAGDVDDLRFLIGKMGIRSVDEVQEHIDRFYPDDVLRDDVRALIAKLIAEVHGG